MATSIITNAGKLNEVESLQNQFSSNLQIYYAIACNFVPSSNTIVPTPNADLDSSFLDPYRNMIFGKKLNANNVLLMIKNYKWVSNTIYSEYDHTVDLTDKKFFVVVDNTTEFYVFICVDSPGTPSTDKPLKADTSPADEFFITNDGYHWKYLYTIEKAIYNRFSTPDFVPIIEDSNVTSNAVAGAIDKIKILESNGSYNTFYANIFSAEGIFVGGNNLIYGIGSDSISQTGAYVDSAFMLTSNTGAGQLRKITNSYSVGNTRLIVIETPFSVNPDVTTTYEITPGVTIIGDGNDAIARALVNASAANTVYAIEIVERGNNYSEAIAFVTANTGGANNVVDLRVIIPPVGGHGANVAEDLLCKSLGLSVTFSNTENSTIPIDGEFKQFGILKNPTYNSVIITYSNILGQFLPNEIVWQITPISLQGTVSVSTSSSNVVGTNTVFTEQFNVGDFVYVSNDSFSALKSVVSITNNTLLVANGSYSFIGSGMSIGRLDDAPVPKGVISSVNVTGMAVISSNGNFTISDTSHVVGIISGAVGNVTNVQLNGENKQYDTVDGRTQFITDAGLSITFSAGDLISQGNIQFSSATVHSFDQTNGILYVANVHGQFVTGSNIVFGSNTCALNSIKKPDIAINSGHILYLENVRKAERSANSSETMKLVFTIS